MEGKWYVKNTVVSYETNAIYFNVQGVLEKVQPNFIQDSWQNDDI